MAVLDPSLKAKNPRLHPKNGPHVIKIKDLIKSTKSKRKALKKNSKELVVPSADKLRRIILLTNTVSRFCRKKVKNPPPTAASKIPVWRPKISHQHKKKSKDLIKNHQD